MVGIRSRIGRRAKVLESLLLGADFYQSLDEIAHDEARGLPSVGVGEDTVIRRAIVDKNARIGRGVRILNEAGADHKDGDGYYIRDGIVIVPKDGVILDGTVI